MEEELKRRILPSHENHELESLLATSFSGPMNLLFIHARRNSFHKQVVESLDAPLICVLGIALELGRGGSNGVHRESPCWVCAHHRASLPSSGRKLIAFPFPFAKTVLVNIFTVHL